MTDDIQADIDRVSKELNAASSADKPKVKKVAKRKQTVEGTTTGDEAPSPPKKAIKKKTKRVSATANGHAAEAKAAKSKRSPMEKEEGIVTLAELALEAKLSGPVARARLRASDVDRGDGRWKFEEGSKRLRQAREILGLSK